VRISVLLRSPRGFCKTKVNIFYLKDSLDGRGRHK
jgi:hypothetical protein